MTAPRFHPSSELILDYARGALDSGRALVLNAHFGACPECSANLRVAEAVGGALLAETPPAAMSDGALERTLAMLGAPPEPTPPAPDPREDWIRVAPEVMTAALKRKRWAAPGVWVATVTHDRKSGARTYLLGVGANIAVPRHTHRGEELICVLKGAFQDGETVHAAGDFSLNDEEIEHTPKTTRDGECVCLIAADHRLVPRGWQARILQPLVGI
jgi:putative transcriptional regulator